MSENKDIPSVIEDKPKELSEEDKERLKKLINKHECMIFMKGTPKLPMCDYGQKMLDVVQTVRKDFETFDILDDTSVREGLKIYSNWPTYPQLYVKGELIGGVDAVIELQIKRELQSRLKPSSA